MATLGGAGFGWHHGELEVQRKLNVPDLYNPTFPGLSGPFGLRVARSPMVAIGTLDAQGRPWTTVWAGERGFARPIADNVLGVRGEVDVDHDPVFRALWGLDDGATVDLNAVVRPDGGGGGQGKMISGVSIDLATRDRVKLGRPHDRRRRDGLEASPGWRGWEQRRRAADGARDQRELGQLSQVLQQARGRPADAVAGKRGTKADLFFLSTTDGNSMDSNHRGGPSGFVRVARNDQEGVELVYPEYSGNRYYQTLGNLRINPMVGIVIPDFDTSDVLYITGTTELLFGPDATAYMPRTNFAVKIIVSSAIFVKGGLPFRNVSTVEYSPYNPPVRALVSEGAVDPVSSAPSTSAILTLSRREPLSPSITRFTFTLAPGPGSHGQPAPRWQAGQHATLDFAPELDNGYQHMCDSDPQSLNDDYIRTFTVSNRPPPQGEEPQEVQITARVGGPTTTHLQRWNLNSGLPLEIPLRGIGGGERFLIAPALEGGQNEAVFVAGGVGITPLLAQAPDLLLAVGGEGEGAPAAFRVLWTLRAADLGLVVDSLERIPGLAERVKLFVTGTFTQGEAEGGKDDIVSKLERLGVAGLERRRIQKDDVVAEQQPSGSENARRRKFFLCAGPALLKDLREWLEQEDVVWEDFGY
ncbi:hypothetical protein ACRALDRAFT_2027618 [Sodiomyces alcalophilus JCM 7366]|uniref:uncharacterized protein n=1 Tax=Sodiomyces alcalophilus JCM 7366 TaxID=591952 RepID=UPI0039B40F70